MESQPGAAPKDAGRLLSLAAVAVAVVALVAAVALPPVSSPPPGGSTTASNSVSSLGVPVPIGTSCTGYAGAQVTISVSGPGTVTVTASTVVRVNHTVGAESAVDLYLSTTASSCAVSAWTATATIAAAQPDDSYIESVHLVQPFEVTAAGSVTFYLNGQFIDGDSSGAAHWFTAGLVAQFHPR